MNLLDLRNDLINYLSRVPGTDNASRSVWARRVHIAGAPETTSLYTISLGADFLKIQNISTATVWFGATAVTYAPGNGAMGFPVNPGSSLEFYYVPNISGIYGTVETDSSGAAICWFAARRTAL